MKQKPKQLPFGDESFATAGAPLFEFAKAKPVNGKKAAGPTGPVSPEILNQPANKVSAQFKKCNACRHKQTNPVDASNWCGRFKKRPAPCSVFEPVQSKEANSVKEVFGDVIHSYSRAQAIEDGVLVDVTSVAEEAGFMIPVAMTRTVWTSYVEVPEGVEGQDEQGRLFDILRLCSLAAKKGGDRVHFKVKVRMKKGYRNIELKAVCGPGDDAGPVITILLPEED